MKKTFAFIAAVVFAAVSCQKEIAPEEPRGDELVFTASLAKTKLEVIYGELYWETTDRIVVYALNGTTALGSVELAPTSIDGSTATFSTSALPAGATSFAAYIKGSGISGLTTKSGVPGFATESNFGTTGNHTWSCAVCTPDNLTLLFQNMSCLLQVYTDRTDVGYIAVQGLNGESIGQTGFISATGEYSKVEDATYMTMDVKAYAAAVAGAPGHYCIALPPGITFSKGFKVMLQGSVPTNTLASFDYTIPVTTASNKLFNFGNFESANAVRLRNKYWQSLIKAHGKDPDEYCKMGFNISPYSFFNSTDSEGWKLQSAIMSGSTNEWLPKYCTTQVFSKEELPNGTLILQIPGSAYRPEGWQNLGYRNTGTRPGEVFDSYVEVTDSWWGNFNYRAFNLYYKNPNLTYAEMCELPKNFAIFVPKESVSDNSVLGIFKNDGFDIEFYEQLCVKVFQKAYWNSQATGQTNYLAAYFADKVNSSPASSYYSQLLPYPVRKDTGASLKNYATEVFTRETLPGGSIIVCKDQFTYRPEGWTDMTSYTSNRPAVCDSRTIIAGDDWWGSFNYRAFNLSAEEVIDGYFGNAQGEEVRASFGIFVPKRW